MCKAASAAHPAAFAGEGGNANAHDTDACDVLCGWFQPAAVDALRCWCSHHAAELPDDVPPVSHQEIRMCGQLKTVFCSDC
jgi:hypothetical protein